MAKRARVHFDGTLSAGPLRQSLCGFASPDLSTTSDLTEVTCAMCLSRLRGPKKEGVRKPPKLSARQLAEAVHAELTTLGRMPQALTPNAGPPPRMTPGSWASVCKSYERRCGSCAICEHERAIEQWAFASPWNTSQRPANSNGDRTPFASLAAALRAFATHKQSDASQSSALGAVLARMVRGDDRPDRSRLEDSREVARVDNVVPVELALRRAYADYRAPLCADDCIVVLLARTAGVIEGGAVTYADLSERYAVGEDALKAIVKHGRRAVREDLEARELIPRERFTHRPVVQSAAYHAKDLPETAA